MDEERFEEREPEEELCEMLREGLGDRSMTAGFSAAREGRLVASVLRQTTREDLSWRGEVVLFRDFVRERVAQSPLLKLLAASLVLHVALGGPLLAYWAYHSLVSPEKAHITFEISEPLFADVVPDEVLELAEPSDAAAYEGRDRVENAIRRARFQLSQITLTVTGGGDALEIRLLRERSQSLTDRRWSVSPQDSASPRSTATPGPHEPGPLATILLAEGLLDQLLFGGERPEALTAVLGRVAGLSYGAAGTGNLAERVLNRARAYGAWSLSGDFDPLAVPAPVDGAWCSAVKQALSARGLSGVTLSL